MVSHDDEQRLLSSIMFGRHEAELRKDAKDRISNPHIHGSAYYHRCDNLSGALLDQIKKEFNISPEMLVGKIMIPVTELKTVSIEAFIQKLGARGVEVIRDPTRSISIVLLSTFNEGVRSQLGWESVRWRLISAGLVASPWEIAQNITTLESDMPALTYSSIRRLKVISLWANYLKNPMIPQAQF